VQAQVSELVSEIGRHTYAGIVSLGPVGVGKSSNLNTIASFMSNRLEQQAASGTGASSLTKESFAHLISYQGRPVKWKWMDTPGDLFTVRRLLAYCCDVGYWL
jgi:ABC-type iron transport system FetAB ATPase subunit